MNIYYLGPVGSYSEIVAKKIFTTEEHILVPTDGFADVVEHVREDGMGILGIENSISSSVHESVDALFQSDIYIIGEVSMNIELHLGGMKDASFTDITDVYSHTQALAQCSLFIKENNLTIYNSSSTAAAIDEVLRLHDTSKAAIGGKASIEEKGLTIVAEHIENTNHNMTRWVIISKNPESLLHPINKVTYAFRVKHEPGSLVAVLKSIADAKGNMTKIESRPVPGSDWEYEFWVDVDIAEGSLETIETSLAFESLTHRRIGAYQKGALYTE
jgi:prephenate dehydratase